MIAQSASLTDARGQRPVALIATLALHALLAAVFLLRQPERPGEIAAHWIDVVPVTPARKAEALVPPAALRKPRVPGAIQARSASPAPLWQAAPPAPAAPAGFPFPEMDAPQPSTFELARAAAGSADKELRKQFPERKLLRSIPLTEQQKLAEGIAKSIAPPKFYEPARITKVQDQGVGWDRRIEKVQTAFGTYCITYEGNHGGDGRDPFKDALQPKMRSCPREE